MAFAHSLNLARKRHDLVAHLDGVAALAREYAGKFGAAEAGYWSGLWHDLGKFHPDFQRYLAECEKDPTRQHRGPKVDHKGAGALLAQRVCSPLAFLVAGHHGGLQSKSAGLLPWLAERGAELRP